MIKNVLGIDPGLGGGMGLLDIESGDVRYLSNFPLLEEKKPGRPKTEKQLARERAQLWCGIATRDQRFIGDPGVSLEITEVGLVGDVHRTLDCRGTSVQRQNDDCG